jgi:methyl-accepting chemotaxis protein
MFAAFGIRQKLILFSILPGIFLAGVGSVGYYALHKVTRIYDQVITVSVANKETLSGIQYRGRELVLIVSRAALAENTDEQLAELKASFEDAILVYDNSAGFYKATAVEAGQGELFDKMQSEWLKMTELGKEVFTLVKDRKPANRTRVHEIMTKDFVQSTKLFEGYIADFINKESTSGDVLVKEIGEIARRGNVASMTAASVGFLLCIIIGFIFSGKISGILRDSALQLGNVVNELKDAFVRVLSSSQMLARSTEKQESCFHETSSSVGQIRATIERAEQNAVKSRDLSLQSHAKATQGKTIVDSMIQKIEEVKANNIQISQQIEVTSREILEFVEVVKNISQKTTIINDIAFQTKLLSFNASVEAARAGTHGLGFAVVATEVGNLAKLSSNAAHEITSLLDKSTSSVEVMAEKIKADVAQILKGGAEKVNEGVAIAHECGEALEKIVSETSLVKSAVDDISKSCQEQSQAIEEIQAAMNELQRVTVENASSTKDTTSAAQSMRAQTELISTLVERLMHIVGEKASPESRMEPPSTDNSAGSDTPGQASTTESSEDAFKQVS